MTLTPTKDNASEDDASQEGITVAIRMRPLNNAEGNNGRIWKNLKKYSSIAQCTRDGKPLGERIAGRTFFTFDKTFGEDTNNRQIYNGVAKKIVTSVVEGLNGTIFAYGQTSSGKTYTMQGAGNIEQGVGGEGGVVHMAANDIFNQIVQKQERIFLVRVSFLEIYNEEVRDLLGDTSQTLKIREDPRRGVYVESNEEIVSDFDGLLKILVRGDKSRTFAATGMNERSSRSHTILRITIESRDKGINKEKDGDDEDIDIENREPSSDGAVRISTLNLVDLAGSESVRHTGATGERQKEGGLINQSLLTLSRVMVALGAPNQMHINFRDSKLTRILQPSLSGNARMAVICCATPSELYLEETRSTLQFASRAKLVKTNAQVNEVLDERSMIRRLQKQLAEAKRNQTGPGQEQVRDLKAQVATAGTQAMEAEEKLDRLKASILNTGYIFDQDAFYDADLSPNDTAEASKKRRKSDGPLLIGHPSPSKMISSKVDSPKTAPRKKRSKVLQHSTLDTNQELKIVQQALATRNNFVRDLTLTLDKYSDEIKEKNSDVERMLDDNSVLNEEKQKAHADVNSLQEIVASLKQALDSLIKENDQALAEKDSKMIESFEKLQQSLGEQGDLRKKVAEGDDIQEENENLKTRLSAIELERSTLKNHVSSLENNSQTELDDFALYTKDLESKISEAMEIITQVRNEKEEITLALQDVNIQLIDTSDKFQQQFVTTGEKESQILRKEEEIKNLESKIIEATENKTKIWKEKEEITLALQDVNTQLIDTSNKFQQQLAATEERDSQIVGKKEEIKNLEFMIVEAGQKNIQVSKEKEEVALTLVDTSNKLQQQLAVTDEIESQIVGKEKEIKNLELRVAEAREQNTQVCKKNEEITLTLEDVNIRLVETTNDLLLKQAQILGNEEEIINLTELQVVLEAENNGFQGSISTMTKEKMSMEAMLLFLQEQVTSVKVEKESSEYANRTLKEKLKIELENLRENNAAVILEKEFSIQLLERNLVEKEATLESEISNKNSVNETLKATEQANGTFRENLREAEMELKILREKNAEVVLENVSSVQLLESRISEIEAQLEGEISHKESLSEALTVTKQGNGALEEKLSEFKKELNSIRESNATVVLEKESSIQLFENRLAETEEKLGNETSLKEVLEQKLCEVQQTVENSVVSEELLKNSFDASSIDMERQLTEAEENLSRVQSEYEYIAIKKDQSIAELESVKESLNQTTTELSSRKTELKEARQKIQSMENEISTKDWSLEKLQADKVQATHQLEEQLNVCREESNELQDTLSSTKYKLEEQEAAFALLSQEKDSSLRKLNDDNEQAIHQLEEQLNVCREEIIELQDTLSGTKSKLEEQETAFAQKSQEKDSFLEKLQADKEQAAHELEQQLDVCGGEINELQDILSCTKAKLKEQEAASALLSQVNEVIQTNLSEMEDIGAVKDSSIEQLNSEKEEITQEVEERREEIELLEVTLQDTKIKLKEQEAEFSQLSQEMDALKSAAIEMEGVGSAKDSSLEQLQSEKDQATQEVEERRGEIELLEVTLQDTKIKLKEQEAEFFQLSQEMEALKSTTIEMEDVGAAKDLSLEQLQSEKNQATQEVEERREEIELLEMTLQDTKIKLKEQEAEFSQLSQEMEALKSTAIEMEDVGAAKDSSLEQLQSEKDQATQEVEERREEIELLEVTLMDTRTKLQGQEAAISELSKENGVLQSTIWEMEDNGAAKDSSLEQSQSEKVQATKEVEEHREEIELLEVTLMDTRTKLEAQEVAFSKLSQEKEETEVINAAKDSSLQLLKSEKEKDTQELEDQVNLCREEIKSLKGILLDTNTKLEDQDASIQKMEDIDATKDLSLEQLQSEKEQDTRELEEQVNACKEEIESLKDTLLGTKTKLEEQDDVMQEMEDIGAAKDSSLKQLQAEKERATHELEDQMSICSEEIESLRVSLLDTKTKLEEQDTAMRELEDIGEAKQYSLEQLQAEKERVIQELEDQMNICREEIESLKVSLLDTTTNLEEQDAAMRKLEDIGAAKESSLEQLQAKKEQELEDQINICKEENQSLKGCFLNTKTKLEELEAAFHQLSAEKADLNATLNSLESGIVSKDFVVSQLQVDKKNLTHQLESHVEENKRVTQEWEDLQRERQSFDATISELRTKLDASKSENTSKDSCIGQLETKAGGLKRQLEGLSANVEIYNNEIESLLLNLMQMTSEKEELESYHVEMKNSCESLANENETIHDRLSVMDMQSLATEEELAILKAEHKLMTERNVELEFLREKSEQVGTKIRDENQNATAEYEKEIVALSEKNARNHELQNAFDNLQSELEDKQSKVLELQNEIENTTSSHEAIIRDREAECGKAIGEVTLVHAQNHELQNAFDNLQSELEDKQSRVLELQNEIEITASSHEAIIRNREAECDKAIGEATSVQTQNRELQNAVENFQSDLEDKQSRVLELQNEIETTASSHEAIIRNREAECNKAIGEATSVQTQNCELRNAVENFQSDLEDKQSRVLELQNEVETMASSREVLAQSLRDREAERNEATSEANSFQTRNYELQNTVDNLQSNLEDKQSRLLELQNEVETMASSREGFTQSLRDREAERDEATRELERLYDENRELNNTVMKSLPKVKEEQLREELSELKAQNLELKHLLASVNESEERLRSVVAAVENNCIGKTSELEDAQYRLSEIEQELSQSRIDGVELSQIEESKADLVECIETVRKEKEHIEQLLQEEKDAKNVLQEQMGEEQRALIQEGENMMTELRNEVGQYEEKLNRSESDAYTARQNIEEINDERKSLEEKYLEASAQVNSSDLSFKRQEDHIGTLISELNDAKSESYALKESVIDMKEKVRRSSRDSEKAARELSTFRKKLTNHENQNESNQIENSRLRKKLKESREYESLINKLKGELESKENDFMTVQEEISVLKLEKEKESSMIQDLEPNKNVEKIANLMSQLKQINGLMEKKDKRLKKLEMTKLTKDQVIAIKKTKAENVNYQKENSNLKNELIQLEKEKSSEGAEIDLRSENSTLKNELIQLKKKTSSKGAETDLKSENSELRFHKDALENKIRKFAGHCQRLEDDKAGMIDALESCNVDMEAHGDDVSTAVIHMCDRLTSIEDIKTKGLSFEKENQSMKQKIDKMAQKEHKLMEKLTQYQHEKARMKKQLESAKNESSNVDSEEKSEKLRFLEQENLQLMHDFKAAKLQLQASRGEVESLRMNVENDFGMMDLQTSTKDAASNLTTSSKGPPDTLDLTEMAKACSENKESVTLELRRSSRKKRNVSSKRSSDELEQTELAKACSENKVSTTVEPRRSSRKTKKRNVLSDQTNANDPRNEYRKENPTEKRQKYIGERNIDERQMNRRSSPGLGESSSHDSEQASECNQS